MNKNLLQLLGFTLSLMVASASLAKLPAPSDEAKAKAAEAAAKTAWNGKVDSFLLCKSQDKVAAKFKKTAEKEAKPVTNPAVKAGGKDAKSAVAASTCTDPGLFVYTPAASPAIATAPTPTATPAPPAVATPAKKS
jgi:hypothetical protein